MGGLSRDRLSRLKPGRWPVLMEAATAVLLARVLLDHRSYQLVDSLFKRWTERMRRQQHPSEREWECVVWAIRAVGRRTLGDRPCLPEALAGRFMLQRRGYQADLHIGVRKGDDGALMAHAWLESGESIVLGGGQSPMRFQRLTHVSSPLPGPAGAAEAS